MNMVNVPAGRYSRPIPRFFYRLRAPLRWFCGTSAYWAFRELMAIPKRIKIRNEHIEAISRGQIGDRIVPIDHPHSVDMEWAEINGMFKLFDDHGWMGSSDLRVYSRGFTEGARCVVGLSSPTSSALK